MNFRVLSLPIEPIEQRYSSQWREWFRKAFIRNGIISEIMNGFDPVTKPEEGRFLNPFETFRWKNSQLIRTLNYIREFRKNVDRFVVFLHDGWFPGCECFEYISKMENIDIQLCSFWHAGSYDHTDLLGMRGLYPKMKHSERSWLCLNSAVFVGSHYHADKILTSYSGDFPRSRLFVTGNPVEVPSYLQSIKKVNRVVWPHRISEDKHPEVFERLSKEPIFKGVEFVRTQAMNLSKDDYYALLKESKVAVSTATHENFGIAMVEAAMLGCYPIVPIGMAYDEVMDFCWQYPAEHYSQLITLVKAALDLEDPYTYRYRDKYNQESVTDEICKIIAQVGGGLPR